MLPRQTCYDGEVEDRIKIAQLRVWLLDHYQTTKIEAIITIKINRAFGGTSKEHYEINRIEKVREVCEFMEEMLALGHKVHARITYFKQHHLVPDLLT